MSHSLTKVWVHGIFSTKNVIPLIKADFEKELQNHIKEKLEGDLDCSVRIIYGTEDHIHLLFLLTPNYSMKQIFHDIKGESSHWINQMGFIVPKFAWQVGYGAFSVSESQAARVKKYIQNQKAHHKVETFKEEYSKFLEKHGLLYLNR